MYAQGYIYTCMHSHYSIPPSAYVPYHCTFYQSAWGSCWSRLVCDNVSPKYKSPQALLHSHCEKLRWESDPSGADKHQCMVAGAGPCSISETGNAYSISLRCRNLAMSDEGLEDVALALVSLCQNNRPLHWQFYALPPPLLPKLSLSPVVLFLLNQQWKGSPLGVQSCLQAHSCYQP